MKKFAPGLRGGSYSEADDFNMQIEIVNGQAFLDRWAGGGWKNISVHKTYEDALQARAEIRSMIQEWRENEREACAMTLLEAAKVFVKRVDDCVPTIFFFEYQKEYNNLCAAIAEHEQASDAIRARGQE